MTEKYKENIFWGVLFLIIGFILLLERLGAFGTVQFPLTSIIFLAFTLAFLGLYLFREYRWPLLVPTFIFLGLTILTLNGSQGWFPGEVGAGSLLICISIPFLIAFFQKTWNWGVLIPGGILFFVGVAVALSAYLHSSFVAAIILWGIGISFFFVFLAKNSNWWAIIPGGILSTAGFLPPLTAFWGVTSAGWVGGLVCAGFAATFGLVYLVDPKWQTRWALYPFGFLLFLALCFIFLGELAAKWWPLLLIALGAYLLVINLRRLNRPKISG